MKQKIELKDAREGDLFTGTYTGVRIENAPLRVDYGMLVVGGSDEHPSLFVVRYTDGMPQSGVEVESITREVPDLPTEPGVYVDKDGELWKRTDDPAYGWRPLGSAHRYSDDDAADSAPFTRLVPVGATDPLFAGRDDLSHENFAAQTELLAQMQEIFEDLSQQRQAECLKFLGIDQKLLYRIFNGGIELNLTDIRELADSLGVHLVCLVRKDAERA